MFSSTSPSLVHTARFDMLDPTSDSNQLNEFPLIANRGYYLDESTSFDESFSNSNYGNESPNTTLNQVGTTGAAGANNTYVGTNTYNVASPYNMGVNAGHSYINYNVPPQQQLNHNQPPSHNQESQSLNHPMQPMVNNQQHIYSFNPAHNNNNEIYNSRMFAATNMDYELLNSSHTPSLNYNASSISDNSFLDSTFFDNSTHVNYGGNNNKYYSPQPMNNTVSTSLVSVNSVSFDAGHVQLPVQQPSIIEHNHLSYTPPSTIGTTTTTNTTAQDYYMNPHINHTSSSPALLTGMEVPRIKNEEDGEEDVDEFANYQLVQQHQHQQQQYQYQSYKYQNQAGGDRRYRVIRGVSAGGSTTRPPKQSVESDSIFLPVELSLNGATIEDICYPQWGKSEKDDGRRIIRIERIQKGPKLMANFSIVGSANENPTTLPAPKNVDVVEVSCLKCKVKLNDEYYDSQSSDEEGSRNTSSPKSYIRCEEDGETYQYYITSVEVVEIVELLIGTEAKDSAEKRRERGRVRSNLVPFWSKKPISSRMNDSSANNSANNTPTFGHQQYPPQPTNQDYRIELAKRIMGYEIRKPRGFDKEVRILRWDKLVPALKRALQSYYTEIPQSDAHLEFN